MAAKIKDGLFIGDAETSQSEVFINDNKISNLINLSGREVPNIWASHGLVYLTYNWEDRPDFRLFSGQDDDILTSIVEFVDVSIAHGISVLLFSKRGTGRCVIAACLYLMMKHRWGFEKSYDYVYSKKPDIDLNKGFIQQMFALDMKLLAARQKAYALKHGVENGFRIEPSMTINDIAAMLPPVEAKRWNSWDPNYILNPNVIINENGGANQQQLIQQPQDEDHVTWPKFADSVSTALKKKDSLYTKVMTNKQKVTFRVMDEAEEELVLIFSFLNSKNTISSLPGPYHNVYDTHKAFKLKFDNVIFEEDVNMFPSSPVNPRYNYTPRGILKGVPKRHQQQAQGQLLLPPSSSTTASAMIQPSTLFESSTAGKRNIMNSNNPNFEPAEDKMAYNRNSYEYQAAHPHQQQQSATADDLYKYVGLGSAEAKVAADGSSLRSSRDEKKGYPESGGGPPDSQWTMEDDRANAGMSAEERLRKLMADMQRQNHFPDHLRPPGHGASHGHGQPPHGHHQQQAKTESGAEDHYYSVNNPSISLHELANMPVQATAAANSDGRDRRGGDSKGLPPPSSHRLDKHQSEISIIDMEKDDFSTSMMMKTNSDPLAAFDLPMPKHSSAMPNTSSSASSQQAQKGALRARHDILGSSTSSAAPGIGNKAPLMPNQTRTSLTRQAWNNPPPPVSSSSAGSSSSMNRPPSPSSANRPASPTTARGVSSNSSVGSQGSGVGGGNFVGTGSTTSQKVYR
jgi:hypothetical protein